MMEDCIEKNYNLQVTQLEDLRKGGSETYRFTSCGRKYILKKVGRAFQDTLEESLKVLAFLKAKDQNVPEVIPNLQNQWMTRLDQDVCLIVYGYIDGKEPERIQWAKLGAGLASLHQALAGYSGNLKYRDEDYYINRYLNMLKIKKYPDDKLQAYETYGKGLWEKVRRLPRGVCHGDLFIGNLLEDVQEVVHILDWDTVAVGFPIYDLVLVCNGTDYFHLDEDDLKRTMQNYKACLEGYHKVRPLSQEEIRAFYDFLAIYHYQLQATILEIHGVECIDHKFIDDQWHWLKTCQGLSKKLGFDNQQL